MTKEAKKLRYKKAREQGICVKCYKKPAVEGVFCAECHKIRYEYQKEYLERKKKCDMDCINCKFEDCINDYVKKKYPKSEEYKKRQNEYQKKYGKAKYEKAKEQGICVKCFKAKAEFGVLCYECKIKQRRKQSGLSKRELYKINGLCCTCGRPRKEGFKVCERCYQICLKMGQAALKSEKYWENIEKQKKRIYYEIKKRKLKKG